ncbi:MAG: XisI protein [bacterium]|nr:XisI protein [bacterium]
MPPGFPRRGTNGGQLRDLGGDLRGGSRRVRNGEKVWIQYDGTDPGVARELVEAGIPREAIVLGFRPPHVRPHTGFAVG